MNQTITRSKRHVRTSKRPTAALAALALSAILGFVTLATPALAQGLELAPEVRAKVAQHPYVRQLTDWGSRPDWSPDSKRLLFVSKEYGDVFELDIATGKTRPLTFHFPHKGFYRAYYLSNGDILLTAARDFDVAAPGYSRNYETELWLMKSDLSGPPVPLNLDVYEGLAVARRSLRIVWSTPQRPKPPKTTPSADPVGEPRHELWSGEIAYRDGVPQVINRKRLLDCQRLEGAVRATFTAKGRRCSYVEPQNFVAPDEALVTLSISTLSSDPSAPPANSTDVYTLDTHTGGLRKISNLGGYNEVEGISADGKWTAVEHADGQLSRELLQRVDLWRVKLDGSGEAQRMTHFNDLDPELKSNQAVFSPDGRWMAFGVGSGTIEKVIPGQGVGIFLMNLEEAERSGFKVR